jgi:hypothetical protein
MKNLKPKLGIVFIFLITLQSYLIPLIPTVSGIDYNKYVNLSYLCAIVAYTIIVLSIIIFDSNDLEVFQDKFSLWIIALTCFFRVNLGGNNEIIYKGILFFLGMMLVGYIIINQKHIKTPSLKSFFVGSLGAIGIVVVGALIRILLLAPNSSHGILPSNLDTYIINVFVFQLSFVTVIEEAYFRGLIFGFLVMNGCKENTALFIQGVLFWGTHYMKMGDPALFFVILPVFTIYATLITKKYKMLYLTIIWHTLNNVFGGILIAIL